jgi:hypothetical protein
MHTIKEHWEDYKTKVIPENASRGQLTECKRAFYAGALGHHNIVSRIDKYCTEEEGIKILEAAQKEFEDFLEWSENA